MDDAATAHAHEQWRIGDLNTRRDVRITAAGRTIKLRQAPGSGLVGTSLWDSAVALVRYIDQEAACCQGPLCGDRLRGARVVELGAGCGLAGMAFAAHGAAVTFTDKPEVMAHLEANVQANQQKGDDAAATFLPFCFGTEPHTAGLMPPYNFVVATDVVYMGSQVAPLIDSLLALSDARTTIVVAMERRVEEVWNAFQRAFKAAFKVKRINVERIRSQLLEETDDDTAADSLGLFIAHRRNRTPPTRTEAEQQAAVNAARVEPPGSGAPGAEPLGTWD